MTRSHREYPSFVPATVDGEVVDRPRAPITYEPMQTTIAAQPSQRAQLRQTETISGTPADRAQAFTIRTRSISIVTGASTAAIWFLVRWALPLTTGASTASVLIVGAVAIVAGLVAFFVVWLAAYAIDMMISPGGVDLFEAIRTQRRIDSQSSAMVDAYRKQQGVDK